MQASYWNSFTKTLVWVQCVHIGTNVLRYKVDIFRRQGPLDRVGISMWERMKNYLKSVIITESQSGVRKKQHQHQYNICIYIAPGRHCCQTATFLYELTCLNYVLSLSLLPYDVHPRGKGPGETVHMRRFVWAVADRRCEQFANAISTETSCVAHMVNTITECYIILNHIFVFCWPRMLFRYQSGRNRGMYEKYNLFQASVARTTKEKRQIIGLLAALQLHKKK